MNCLGDFNHPLKVLNVILIDSTSPVANRIKFCSFDCLRVPAILGEDLFGFNCSLDKKISSGTQANIK